ncbi:MAG TPA: cytochrome c maturation protein CcmE [Candidatus Limnocylindria bacterium]|nr:cytochrome c maturation protein CcmE [Candidatus Limnocylindria bacterium]
MTLEQPAPPSRSRWGLLLAVAIVVGAIAWLAFSGIGSALVYYRTPTELQALGEEAIGSSMRLGGLVKPDTLSCEDGQVAFTMTDGTTEIDVRSLRGGNALLCPREGVGVVVQGQLSVLGVFEPTEVIVKHDENYVAPSGSGIPSQVIDPGSGT